MIERSPKLAEPRPRAGRIALETFEQPAHALSVLDHKLALLWKLTHPSGQRRTKPFELWREPSK